MFEERVSTLGKGTSVWYEIYVLPHGGFVVGLSDGREMLKITLKKIGFIYTHAGV